MENMREDSNSLSTFNIFNEKWKSSANWITLKERVLVLLLV